MKIGSIYYASDKAMFDALTQRKVTIAHLRELFLSRGIIISPETDKESLARQFSSFFHDYADYQKLSILIGAHSVRERTTNINITTAVTPDDMMKSLESTKEFFEAEDHDVIDISSVDGVITCTIHYQKTDYGQSEFRQVVQKQAVVKLEPFHKGWKVSGPMNDKFKNLSAQLQSQIEIMTEREVKVSEISLSAYPDPELRTRFFRELIDRLPKLKQVDVIDVATFNPKIKEVDLTDEDLQDDGEDDELQSKGVRPTTHITKAQLSGQGVLESEQLLALEAQGFYICKILWHATDSNQIDSDVYVVEAQFGNKAACSDFSYILKGVKHYQSSGVYGARVKASSVEEERIKKLIVRAAEDTIKFLTTGKP
ncbi:MULTISPECIES: hypothetical protein [Pseudomonas]|uniref:hypothetical protein n=1 Tax=Pseudomonas TaxID=286 RepID=UPI0018E737AD|nr:MULTISPECIES: hypothetical protein [Pseudomonas]MBJ2223955.1 hypothetical protein [Pseudomonas sp. MF7451]MBW9239118.1 hypothetical protein [Pseudomonas carnis]MDH0798721.1 hypothetical protein [Pseudomonas carnis]